MNDLNMINAHNAELRSIGSPSGLSCEMPYSSPDVALVDEFRRVMDDGCRHSGERSLMETGGDEKSGTAGTLAAPADGEASMLFASLFSMGSGVSEASATEAGGLYPPLSPDDLEALVERILVSSAECGHNEIRLTLSERILAGTEIIIKRDIDGQLIVSLHCTSEASFQTLVASQTDLMARLEDFENRSVQVSVNISREDSHADRRSRGYIEQDQPEA